MLPEWLRRPPHKWVPLLWGPTAATKMLLAPEGFWRLWVKGATPSYKSDAQPYIDTDYTPPGCNGCGGQYTYWIKDKLQGLSFTLPCNIHDYMCCKSNWPYEQRFSDRLFRWNSLQWNEAHGGTKKAKGERKLVIWWRFIAVRLWMRIRRRVFT